MNSTDLNSSRSSRHVFSPYVIHETPSGGSYLLYLIAKCANWVQLQRDNNHSHEEFFGHSSAEAAALWVEHCTYIGGCVKPEDFAKLSFVLNKPEFPEIIDAMIALSEKEQWSAV